MRRFCLVTPDFPDRTLPQRGGVATYCEMLAASLLASGWEVTVVLFHENEGSWRRTPDPVLPVTMHQVLLPSGSRLSGRAPGFAEGLVLWRAVEALDRATRFDRIEGQAHEGFCWALALRFGRRFALRMHTSLRQHILNKGEHWTMARRFAVWLDGFTARKSHTVVTHTVAHGEEMRNEYRLGRRTIYVIPHATPDAPLTPFRSPARLVGYVGSLDRRKGADLFLEAAAIVAASRPEVGFVLIGRDPSGAMTATGQQLREQGQILEGRLELTGGIRDDEIEGWWAKIDLLVVPSRYESFGLTLVEAFSRGIPVVCTDALALVEVLGEVCSPVAQRPDAIAADILVVLSDDQERVRRREAGRVRHAREYSQLRVTQRIGNLYAG